MADFGKLNFSVSFNPTSGFPLDARYYFSTLASAQEAAASAVEVGSADGTYFIGQNIVVVEGDTATLYVIQPNKELKAVDAYTAGTGISISGENEIGVKVVAANGLSVDASGIKMAVATTGTAGALSAADKTKLDSVSSGAQANVIESISINGEKISPVEKDVPIPIAAATRLGVIKADNTSISISGDGTASVKSVNTSLLSQNEDDVLIIDCSI